MKIIYLKADTEQEVKYDLKSVFPDWNEVDIDFNDLSKNCHGHYIGKLIDSVDENGDILYKDGYHANILVPDGFEHEWQTLTDPPDTPDHIFLGHG